MSSQDTPRSDSNDLRPSLLRSRPGKRVRSSVSARRCCCDVFPYVRVFRGSEDSHRRPTCTHAAQGGISAVDPDESSPLSLLSPLAPPVLPMFPSDSFKRIQRIFRDLQRSHDTSVLSLCEGGTRRFSFLSSTSLAAALLAVLIQLPLSGPLAQIQRY